MTENITWDTPEQSKTMAGVANGDAKVRLRYPPDIISNSPGHIDNPYMFFSIVKFRSKQWQIDRRSSGAVVKNNDDTAKKLFESAGLIAGAKEILGSVVLPLPKDLSNDINVDWEMADLGNLLGLAMGAAATGSIDGISETIKNNYQAIIMSDRASQVMRNKTPNPRKQALFNGVQPRQFSFTWVFAPQSQREATLVQEIIKTFTEFSLPSLDNNDSAFYDFPAEFEIRFSKNTKGLPVMSSCVCTSVATNFNPSADIQLLEDGHPVQTQLTLTFIETELLRRNKPGV